MPESSVVGVRIPVGIVRLIDKDIQDSEEFVTRTDWLMTAIRFYLHHREDVGAIQRDSVGGGGQTNP